VTARDPRLASHSLRDDERPSPRRPITMPRELWARIDAARGEQSCAEWLRAAALAKLDGHTDGLLVQLEEAARLLVERLTTGDVTPARRLAAVRRDLPALVETLRELDQARGWPVRDPTLGQGVDVEPAAAPLAIRCPVCEVAPGVECITAPFSLGTRYPLRKPHRARTNAADAERDR
jgi:hypothetical protein